MADDDEEEIISYYFYKNYEYDTILSFLENYHDIKISKGTLLNRLKGYGLRRRGREVNEDQVRQCIRQELDGPGCLLGYRAMWSRLHSKYGISVPRSIVQVLLRDLDPEASKQRKKHRLKRRKYLNPGPNYSWHSDGYDKLKPFIFPIHGCIDGFSRRVIWLKLTRTNNDPYVIGSFFLESLREVGGCPSLLRTDRGTENGIMATIQCFLRRNSQDSLAGINAHRYGASHSNQRIEAWWSFLRRSWSSWWIDFFKDKVDRGLLDTSNTLQMECLWFCFSKIIQNELDETKDSWNTHYIRESRYHTEPGIPDQLYFLPETIGRVDHKFAFDISDLREAEHEAISPTTDDTNDYQNYFSEIIHMLGISEPTTWKEGLATFNQLVAVAE